MKNIPTILALDVNYHGADEAAAAGVLFVGWDAQESLQEEVVSVTQVAEYKSGEFFRRELPCLIAVIRRFEKLPDIFVIDGYVWLDRDGRPGLGAHLCEQYGKSRPVIGIAKTRFHEAPAVEVLRGFSRRPIFVTAVGIEPETAAAWVKSMSGPYRIPDLIKRADELSRVHH